ncbi:MAG: hypothetical protein AAGF74_04505 [Pseudomonadota bacterium]
MRALIFVLPLVLAACAARPLTEAERAFTETVAGDAIDIDRVTIVKGAAVGLLNAEIPVRPRTTCRQKLLPPRSEPASGTYPAFVIGERIYFTRRFWRDDFLADYPDAMNLRVAMRFAHEMTHVWQWQERQKTGYHPFKAVSEHIEKDDPYLTEIDPEKGFLDYAYEQQGILVEEFVCCRALDPDGARTDKLRALVAEVFPAAARDEEVPRDALRLPWPEADIEGICG